MNRLLPRSVLTAFLVGAMIAALVILYAAYQRKENVEIARAAFGRYTAEASTALQDSVNNYQPLIQLLARYGESNATLPSRRQWRHVTAQLNLTNNHRPAALWLLKYRANESNPENFSSILQAVDAVMHDELLGQDLAKQATLRSVLQMARDSGEVVASAPLSFESGQGTTGAARFVLVAPMYKGGGEGHSFSLAERRAGILGFVVAECRMQDIMTRTMPALAKGIAVKVVDVTDESGMPMYTSDVAEDFRPMFRETQGLALGGRLWRLEYSSTDEYESPLSSKQRQTLIGGGIILAAIIAALVWRLMHGWSGAQLRAEDAGRELQRSEERLQHVIAATNDGVWEYDLQNRIYTYLSPQAFSIFGESRAQAMLSDSEAAGGIIHYEDRPAVKAAFEAHLEGGAPYDVEMRVKDAEDSWRWVRSRGEVIREGAAGPRRMVGSISDISEAREASQRLLRYQELMRTVLDVIPEPVLVKDRNFRLLMVNRAYADRAGYPADQLIGKETHELLPADQADRLVQADVAVFESGEDQVFELSIQNRLLHTVRNYIVTKRLAHDIDGEPIMVGLHSDVTELRRSIAQFAAVIEETPLVAVQGFNRNCVVTHWNHASEALFGYKRAQVLGSRLQDVIFDARMQRLFEATVENVWATRMAFTPREIRLRLPDGRKVWLLATIFPVIQEGVVVELFSMAVDVTARREAERQLAMHRDNLQALVNERTAGLLHAKQEVERALQAKSEFLANMSHELRTPMHAILSFARLGEDKAFNGPAEKLRDYFNRIATSGDRLLGLINNLLDLSKLEAGKMLLDVRSVDVATLARTVARELEPLLDKKALHLELPAPSSATLANVDPARFTQVIANLLSNAINYSPFNGTISVSMTSVQMPAGRRATDRGDRPALQMTIADSGPGIPPGELEYIFDKFVQSSKTRTGAGGTGLGLAICREIVAAHKGRITARNRPEGGALFQVIVPIDTPLSEARVGTT